MPDRHLSSQFDSELNAVSTRVMELGGLVESQIRQAVYALSQFSAEVADEVAMIIKTRRSLADAVLAETKRLHPYELPALLVLPTEGGSDEYCGWIVGQTGSRS